MTGTKLSEGWSWRDVVAICFWVLLAGAIIALYAKPVVFFGGFIYRDLTRLKPIKFEHKTVEQMASDCQDYPELRRTQTCIEFLGPPQ